MIDTDTRLIPPAAITEATLAELDDTAARLVAETLALNLPEEPLPSNGVSYRGRHRTTDDVDTRRIAPETLAAVAPREGHTELIPALALRSVDDRSPLGDASTPAPKSPFLTSVQDAILGALHKLRGGRR